MNTRELAAQSPRAFNALPEPYREDDCLLFYRDLFDNLFCCPNKENEDILGHWEAMYDPKLNEWVSV